MSRSYRVSVSESLRTVLKAHDRVSTQLELLEVLPCDQMAELLAQELLARGFERDGEVLVREEDGVKVTVDPRTGTVTVTTEASKEVDMEGKKEGRAYDDMGPNSKSVKEQMQQELKKELQRKADQQTQAMQTVVTDKLEKALGDIRRELDQAVNRVTAEALKQKAASLGQIKEITEDPQSGSLTIVLEV